jgi:hypothetical protein
MVGIYKHRAWPYLFLFLGSGSCSTVVSPTNDPVLLANSALDASVGVPLTLVNATYSGAKTASGTFTDGPQNFGSGIILTTGAASGSLPSSPNPGPGVDNKAGGSVLCTKTLGSANTYNAAVLDMYVNVPAGWDGITAKFIFASSEYPE